MTAAAGGATPADGRPRRAGGGAVSRPLLIAVLVLALVGIAALLAVAPQLGWR